MKLSHDDQLRQARHRLETPAELEEVSSEPPVQLSRTILNRARAAQLVTPATLARYRQAHAAGGMRQFLATARTLQRLPSFTGRRRE